MFSVKDDGAILTLGAELRQQIGYQSVLALGIQGDIAGESGDRKQAVTELQDINLIRKAK